MIIGITGGIGSGKTTLSNIIRSQGYPVYDTDREARIIQNSDQDVIRQTKDLFGEDIYRDGQLDRQAVASLVFRQPELLQKLSSIVHPAVKKGFLQWITQFNPNDLVFVESAVLFEGGFNSLTDKIILVTASEEVRIRRVMARDKVDRSRVTDRIKNQIPEAEKLPGCDLVINTDQGIPDDVMQSIVVWKH